MDYNQYDELADRSNAAYLAFRRIYETEHLPPQKPDTESDDIYTRFGLNLMLLASMAVSGSRTITEFGGDIVAVFSFIMVECGIVLYAFLRTSYHYDKIHHESLKKMTTRGMYLAIIIALSANIHASMKKAGFEWEYFDYFISILLGFAAPTLAFIAGELFGMMRVMKKKDARQAQMTYDEAMQTWLSDLNKSWTASKGRWGVVVKVESNTIQLPSNGQSIGQNAVASASTLGHTKKPDASETVRRYIQEHPDALNQSAYTLGEFLQVGKSTVNNVQREIKSQQNGHVKAISNGHSEL